MGQEAAQRVLVFSVLDGTNSYRSQGLGTMFVENIRQGA